MKKDHKRLINLSMFVLLFLGVFSELLAQQWDLNNPFLGPISGGTRKPRVIITTDHGTCDYDDIQSLGHLFIYADVLDIRGLIESHPRCDRDEKTSYVVDAYEADYQNLITYSSEYPTPDYLRSIIVQGNYGAQPEQGYSNPSPGSQLIISEAKKATPDNPVWVLVWGAITDVAQALHDDPSIKSSIRVYFIASWNRGKDENAANYIDREHKDLWYIEDTYTHRGLYQYVGAHDIEKGPPHKSWADVHIKGHGKLGDCIMAEEKVATLSYDGFKAGDTPSLLHVLHGNLDDPGSSSWSGEFQRPYPKERPNYWADKEYPRAYMDKWRNEIFEDFANRMDRAQKPNGIEERQSEKHRILVLTDISPKDAEPDDYESLIRLLVYSNQWDIEGIISTTSCWKKEELYTNILRVIIEKYGRVRENLLRHESGFPEADYLLSIVKAGNDGYGMDDVSMKEESEGFRHIIEVVDRPDPRPVWILLWGGANTLAQSIFYLENMRSKDEVHNFIEKIRVYDIQGQDDAGAWICHNYPEIFWLRCYMMNKGISRQLNKDTWPEAYGGNEEIVSPEWFKENVNNHGVLGNDYPMAKYKFEGDSPSFFYLMTNGLNDPMKPWYGSLGGRYSKEKKKNVNGGNNKLVEEGQKKYFPYYMFAPAGDTWDYPNGVNAPYIDNIYASLFRWREAFQNEFAARMDWCVKDYKETNHPPVAMVMGGLNKSVVSGERVNLSADGSHDPDGNTLRYNWYYYKEPGNYGGDIIIENENSCNASFIAPDVDYAVEIHILLTVTDTGIPSLSRYQRIIVNVDY